MTSQHSRCSHMDSRGKVMMSRMYVACWLACLLCAGRCKAQEPLVAIIEPNYQPTNYGEYFVEEVARPPSQYRDYQYYGPYSRDWIQSVYQENPYYYGYPTFQEPAHYSDYPPTGYVTSDVYAGAESEPCVSLLPKHRLKRQQSLQCCKLVRGALVDDRGMAPGPHGCECAQSSRPVWFPSNFVWCGGSQGPTAHPVVFQPAASPAPQSFWPFNMFTSQRSSSPTYVHYVPEDQPRQQVAQEPQDQLPVQSTDDQVEKITEDPRQALPYFRFGKVMYEDDLECCPEQEQPIPGNTHYPDQDAEDPDQILPPQHIFADGQFVPADAKKVPDEDPGKFTPPNPDSTFFVDGQWVHPKNQIYGKSGNEPCPGYIFADGYSIPNRNYIPPEAMMKSTPDKPYEPKRYLPLKRHSDADYFWHEQALKEFREANQRVPETNSPEPALINEDQHSHKQARQEPEHLPRGFQDYRHQDLVTTPPFYAFNETENSSRYPESSIPMDESFERVNEDKRSYRKVKEEPATLPPGFQDYRNEDLVTTPPFYAYNETQDSLKYSATPIPMDESFERLSEDKRSYRKTEETPANLPPGFQDYRNEDLVTTPFYGYEETQDSTRYSAALKQSNEGFNQMNEDKPSYWSAEGEPAHLPPGFQDYPNEHLVTTPQYYATNETQDSPKYSATPVQTDGGIYNANDLLPESPVTHLPEFPSIPFSTSNPFYGSDQIVSDKNNDTNQIVSDKNNDSNQIVSDKNNDSIQIVSDKNNDSNQMTPTNGNNDTFYNSNQTKPKEMNDALNSSNQTILILPKDKVIIETVQPVQGATTSTISSTDEQSNPTSNLKEKMDQQPDSTGQHKAVRDTTQINDPHPWLPNITVSQESDTSSSSGPVALNQSSELAQPKTTVGSSNIDQYLYYLQSNEKQKETQVTTHPFHYSQDPHLFNDYNEYKVFNSDIAAPVEETTSSFVPYNTRSTTNKYQSEFAKDTEWYQGYYSQPHPDTTHIMKVTPQSTTNWPKVEKEILSKAAEPSAETSRLSNAPEQAFKSEESGSVSEELLNNEPSPLTEVTTDDNSDVTRKQRSSKEYSSDLTKEQEMSEQNSVLTEEPATVEAIGETIDETEYSAKVVPVTPEQHSSQDSEEQVKVEDLKLIPESPESSLLSSIISKISPTTPESVHEPESSTQEHETTLANKVMNVSSIITTNDETGAPSNDANVSADKESTGSHDETASHNQTNPVEEKTETTPEDQPVDSEIQNNVDQTGESNKPVIENKPEREKPQEGAEIQSARAVRSQGSLEKTITELDTPQHADQEQSNENKIMQAKETSSVPEPFNLEAPEHVAPQECQDCTNALESTNEQENPNPLPAAPFETQLVALQDLNQTVVEFQGRSITVQNLIETAQNFTLANQLIRVPKCRLGNQCPVVKFELQLNQTVSPGQKERVQVYLIPYIVNSTEASHAENPMPPILVGESDESDIQQVAQQVNKPLDDLSSSKENDLSDPNLAPEPNVQDETEPDFLPSGKHNSISRAKRGSLSDRRKRGCGHGNSDCDNTDFTNRRVDLVKSFLDVIRELLIQ